MSSHRLENEVTLSLSDVSVADGSIASTFNALRIEFTFDWRHVAEERNAAPHFFSVRMPVGARRSPCLSPFQAAGMSPPLIICIYIDGCE